MKQPKDSSHHDWMDDRVEAYLDGDLSGDDLARFEQTLEDEPYWRTQVQNAARIQESLHDVSLPSAPPELAREVFAQTSRAHQPASWWREALQNAMHTWRALVSARRNPVVDYGIGIALVAVAVFFIVNPMQSSSPPSRTTSQSTSIEVPPSSDYSASEIARAKAKAKWTFGYLSDFSETSSQDVQSHLRRAFAPLDAQLMQSGSLGTAATDATPDHFLPAVASSSDDPERSQTTTQTATSQTNASASRSVTPPIFHAPSDQ